MSTHPRTDAVAAAIRSNGPEWHPSTTVMRMFANVLEAEVTALRKELAEVTIAFQAECDHDFVTEDHSFSHEFGTEKIFVCRCSKCGKDAEPDDVPDPDEDGCDDGPRDAREEARLDP